MVSRSDDIRLRELLTERLGDEAAKRLLERLPIMPVTNLATKDDLAALRGEVQEVRGEVREVRGEVREVRGEVREVRGEVREVRGEMQEVRGELLDEMGRVRGGLGELRGEMGNLRAEMERSTKSTIKWVAGLVFPTLAGGIGASAAIAAAIAS